MLIDFTYFDSAFCRIPGINATNRGEATSYALQLRADIGTMIAEFEPRFLQMMLGKDWANLSQQGEVVSVLVNSEARTSPIAKYVWYHWASANATRNTAAGEKVKDGESSTSANIVHRATLVWNSMVDDVAEVVANLLQQGYNIAPDLTAPIFQKRNVFGI